MKRSVSRKIARFDDGVIASADRDYNLTLLLMHKWLGQNFIIMNIIYAARDNRSSYVLVIIYAGIYGLTTLLTHRWSSYTIRMF